MECILQFCNCNCNVELQNQYLKLKQYILIFLQTHYFALFRFINVMSTIHFKFENITFIYDFSQISIYLFKIIKYYHSSKSYYSLLFISSYYSYLSDIKFSPNNENRSFNL